jgi:hypothetical protein
MKTSLLNTRVLIACLVGISIVVTAMTVSALQDADFDFPFAQRSQRGRSYSDRFRDPRNVDRNGVPEWEVNADFQHDVFTFVRIEYDSYGGRGYGRGGGNWLTDFPDSDLNFSFRLQELTSLKVSPHPKIFRLTDDELLDYPFIYVIEPGRMTLADEEVKGLRKYLLNGGFMMVDDFWGEDEWQNFYEQIKLVFPDREPQELPLEHEIFHCVYDLKVKPQVPSIHAWMAGHTYERYDASEAHYRAIFDDKGRIMTIICHNTDLGDGWEREGVDPEYFHQFSEKYSYPMGINIVVYAMTH